MKRKEKLLLLWVALILALAGGYYYISNAADSNAAAAANSAVVSLNSSKQNVIALWNYNKADNLSEFGFPISYQEYVMPDNPVVQRYAWQLKAGLYWNYLTYENGSIFHLNYQNDTSEGIWQNPDYTLTVGHGDCEDIALAVCSILKAKKIEAVVVMGYVFDSAGEKNGHSWVEYYMDGKYYISDRFSFERNIITENEIAYYFSPEIKVTLPGQETFILWPNKYQPYHIFNNKLKKRPYLKDWAISGLEI